MGSAPGDKEPDAARTPRDDKDRSTSGRWRPAILFALCAAALTGASVFVLSFDRVYTRSVNPETENAYVGGDVTAIGARVQGYVTGLPVADYQPIHAGDLIARVDDRDYTARRDQARANVEVAVTQVASLQAQQRQLLVQIGVSQASELGSEAATGRTSPELSRQRMLIHTDVGQSRLLDRAEADQKTAFASILSAKAEYVARRRQAEVLAARLGGAEAALAARRADLALAELNLGWTRITAPVNGVLGARRVRVGDLLVAGTHVLDVTPLDGVWVDANLTERQVTDIRMGQRATIRLDAFPDQVLEGRVTGLSPITGGRLGALAPDNTTGNFTKVVQRVPVRVTILWDGSPLRGLVRPGMSAVVTVLTQDAP